MGEELCQLTAMELRALVACREISPVEVTEAAIRRAKQLQPRLNCLMTICEDQAMEAARSAEKAVLRGELLGLLHGVPFTCKDVINTRGVRTTFGSRLFENNVPEADAEVVARLRNQGAILIGKTTTSEFAAKCLTDAPLFGSTPNAWSAAHTSGGSSGGTAVAVAAGITPIGIATDGGGSTRIPASCNGVVGLKQSVGLVPHSQTDDLYGEITYVTPMSRTVADTALMLQAMAGEHPGDPWSIGSRPQDYVGAASSKAGLKGKRILFCAAPKGRPISAEVDAAFRSSLAHLRALGAELMEMSSENFNIEPMWRTINHTVWRANYAELARDHADLLSPSFLKQMALVTDVSGVEYQKAMFDRTQLFRYIQSLFVSADLLVMPTLSRTALPIDQDLFGTIEIDGKIYPEVRPNWFPWTMPFNLTGHPAISIPCGFGKHGLPIGIQMVGRFRQDAELLGAAAVLEESLGLIDRRPAFD